MRLRQSRFVWSPDFAPRHPLLSEKNYFEVNGTGPEEMDLALAILRGNEISMQTQSYVGRFTVEQVQSPVQKGSDLGAVYLALRHTVHESSSVFEGAYNLKSKSGKFYLLIEGKRCVCEGEEGHCRICGGVGFIPVKTE